MIDNNNIQAQQQISKPDPALKGLEVLVGTWIIKGHESSSDGEIHGKVTFEWMEGGFFLVQYIDIDCIGQKIKGIDYIRYDESKQALTSHYFDNTGNALEYMWEVGDDTTITIWGGYVGSPANFKDKFSEDGNIITGRWEWPRGGYDATVTRVKRMSMRKIISQTMISLDGSIEGLNKELDWHVLDDEMEKYADDLLNTVDAILLGPQPDKKEMKR